MVLNNEFFVSSRFIIISAILGKGSWVFFQPAAGNSFSTSTDFAQALLRKNAGEKELVFVSRLSVILVACCSLALASNPNNYIPRAGSIYTGQASAPLIPCLYCSVFLAPHYYQRRAIAGVFWWQWQCLSEKNFCLHRYLRNRSRFHHFSLAIYVVSLLIKTRCSI